jgi:hypothetical protein
MGIPYDNTEAATTGSVPTTSPVTHTPQSYGPSNICVENLHCEQGNEVEESWVPIDVMLALFEVEYQNLYDNNYWHQGSRWGVTQLANRTLNGHWHTILICCSRNPTCLANPFEEIEHPSTQSSDVSIGSVSEFRAVTRA